MRADELDYELPSELIAQHPPEVRGASRLLVVHRDSGVIEHRHFAEIGEYLHAGDLLVVNDTKVKAVRLNGRRMGTGGLIEVFLLEERGSDAYRAMTRSGGKLVAGEKLGFTANDHGEAGFIPDAPELVGELLSRNDDGSWEIALRSTDARDVRALIDDLAQMPLPPYIRRERFDNPFEAEDRERYQTVYAREEGAVAAPTAGLHFTDAILAQLAAQGVERANVTLHVGPGTFAPVKADQLEDHPMHAESFNVCDASAAAVKRCKQSGGRVVAVGSTSTRVLESMATDAGELRAGVGSTDLLISPGYRFKCVDVMLTNFHLPRSTLLALVFAIAGVELTREAYAQAVREKYRFFSYGDAMLIL